jgi:uncharacterized protein YcbX
VPATVARLNRYPVKSLQGEELTAAEIGPAGIAGDRMLAFVAAGSGEVLSAKRTRDLLTAETRMVGEGVEVRLPEGDWLPAPSAEVDRAASEWLGTAVRLVGPDPDQSGMFRMSFNLDDEDQDVFEWPTPPGSFVDLAPIHLLTTASLRAAARLHPDGAWAVERFRPGVVVDVDDAEGFVEDDWVGGRVRLGPVELEVSMPTIRCPMPTRAQRDLPRDLDIVKTLNREHDGNLGVYGTVVTPGVVSVGDTVLASGPSGG